MTCGFNPYDLYLSAHVHPLNKLWLFLMGMVMASEALLQAATLHARHDGRPSPWRPSA